MSFIKKNRKQGKRNFYVSGSEGSLKVGTPAIEFRRSEVGTLILVGNKKKQIEEIFLQVFNARLNAHGT